jgi:hypothetical protein
MIIMLFIGKYPLKYIGVIGREFIANFFILIAKAFRRFQCKYLGKSN